MAASAEKHNLKEGKMKAVIAGTGVDEVLSSFEENMEDTYYGYVTYYRKGDVIIIPRHRKNHTDSPSMVNYKANISALVSLGCSEVIGIYAVGSITDKLPPSSFALVGDFMDFSGRSISFFNGEENPLKHTCMDNVFDSELNRKIKEAAGCELADDIVYVMTNGPRLETAGEIRAFCRLGADVVGMTLATEASLLKELGLRYSALAYSINWAQGVRGGEMSFISSSDTSKLCRHILDTALRALS